LGIGHGRGIAGKIGTPEQSKVGVFGSVVNLTARLEGLTKRFGTSILIDEATAGYVRQHLVPQQARCRRIARVQPYGMDAVLMVSELLPPADKNANITDGHLQLYEESLDAVLQGCWEDARRILGSLSDVDPAKHTLLEIIEQYEDSPNAWDGVLRMTAK
jgi:adenylate cyclase